MYIEIMLAAYICERLLVSLGINALYITTGLHYMKCMTSGCSQNFRSSMWTTIWQKLYWCCTFLNFLLLYLPKKKMVLSFVTELRLSQLTIYPEVLHNK